MNNGYGLLERDWVYIRKSLEEFPEIEIVILFGSRAMGNYKTGSDVDLAIVGNGVTYHTLLELSEWLNEIYPLPYMFDLHNYHDISNENLKRHIETFGIDVYHSTRKEPEHRGDTK